MHFSLIQLSSIAFLVYPSVLKCFSSLSNFLKYISRLSKCPKMHILLFSSVLKCISCLSNCLKMHILLIQLINFLLNDYFVSFWRGQRPLQLQNLTLFEYIYIYDYFHQFPSPISIKHF